MRRTLRRADLDVYSLMLPGHGGQPMDLLQVDALDWINAVRDEYRRIKTHHATCHLVGVCMGALLAIEVAKLEPCASDRLALLAPPVFIDGWATPWYRQLRHLLYRMPKLFRAMKIVEDEPFGIKNELTRSIIRAKFERGNNFHYRWVPLHCIEQVDHLRKAAMSNLDVIRAPTLIVHAQEDELTSPRSAFFIQQQMCHAPVTLRIVENSYHMICVDNDRELVAASVQEHLRSPHEYLNQNSLFRN